MAATIQERAEQFLIDNPGFLEEFTRRSFVLQLRGFQRFSADAILHSMRYDRAVQTTGDDNWKINNNISSRIVRIAEQCYPQLQGFFEKRPLRAA